jgi:hypothetical protein
METNQKKWEVWHTFALIIIIVAMVVLSVLMPSNRRQTTLILNLLLLFIFILIAGYGVTGRLSGLLIDNRNKWSLSRLQMILWIVVILSGYFTAALFNIVYYAKTGSPLSIKIPGQLWLLMGISTTSLIGSPLILSNKKEKEPEKKEKIKTFNNLALQKGIDKEKIKDKVDSVGQVVVNADIKDAGISDLFKGEETGNAAYLDLGKIQMFFFTIILIIVYSALLFSKFAAGNGIYSFPELDSGMIALLGISHGGYLINKAVPHSKTGTV